MVNKYYFFFLNPVNHQVCTKPSHLKFVQSQEALMIRTSHKTVVADILKHLSLQNVTKPLITTATLFSNGRSVRMETQTGIAFLSDHSFVNPLKLHLQPDSTENNRGHSYLSCHHFLFIPCMSSIFIRHHLGFWSPNHARVTKD